MPRDNSSTTKAKYWILTIPQHDWIPHLNHNIAYIKGQMELGENTNYLHWQILIVLKQQQRLSFIKKIFDTAHAEPSRSEAANEYVWKENTSVPGTRFELGTMPFKRNNADDWKRVLELAKSGQHELIPPDIYIGHYRAIKCIGVENALPLAIERHCTVFWGRTGSGKSRRAWSEAGLQAYPKDPCSKFWDGYRGQANVVIDEFRGTIGISHMLRWLDRYPVLVEVKGSSVVFNATHIWITSNLHPKDWYKDLDELTTDALLRRLTIIEIN